MCKLRRDLIVDRLLFERGLRIDILLSLPYLILSAIVVSTVLKEYPVEEFYSLRLTIDSAIDFSSTLRIWNESALHSYLNETLREGLRSIDLLAGNSTSVQIQSDSVLVGSPFVYYGNQSYMPAGGYFEEAYLRQSSTVIRDSSVMESTECADCVVFVDPRIGSQVVKVSPNLSEVPLEIWPKFLGIVLLLFAPKFNDFSIARIDFEVGWNQEVHGDSTLNTFRDLSGDSVVKWLSLSGVIASVITCITDLMQLLECPSGIFGSHLKCRWKRKRRRFLEHLSCLLIAIFSIVVFALKWRRTFQPDWVNLSSLSLTLKDASERSALFGEILNVEYRLDLMRTLDVVLINCLVFRFTVHASSHPRLAMMIETLYHGLQDLIHFALVYISLLLGFAYVFSLMFSADYYYASTYTRSVFVQFQFLVGSLSFEEFAFFPHYFLVIGYFILYGLVMYFVGLYFVLALITAAYEKYLTDLKELSSANDTIRDIIALVIVTLKQLTRRWPSYRDLVAQLRGPEEVKGDGELEMLRWCTARTEKRNSGHCRIESSAPYLEQLKQISADRLAKTMLESDSQYWRSNEAPIREILQRFDSKLKDA